MLRHTITDMRIGNTLRHSKALTLIEALVIVAVIAIAAILFLPHRTGPHVRAPRIHCVNNLKNIALSFHIYANENGDLFPHAISDADGGAFDSVTRGDVSRVYQIISDIPSDPKILVCPSDSRAPANEVKNIGRSNISYFISLDATNTKPDMILAGDRDVSIQQTLLSGSQNLTADKNVTWSGSLHKEGGNILFADGHVEQLRSAGLLKALKNTGDTNNRVLFPQ